MSCARSLWLAGLAALLLVGGDAAAAKPEASFALVDGWIEARVEHEGRPAKAVRIQVFDVIGAPFAQGEIGEEGVGTFPRPRGHTCRLAISIGGKECDSVLLRFEGSTGIEPSRVQLTFGDRSCCRVPGRAHLTHASPAPEPEPRRHVGTLLVAGGICLVAAALVLALRWRREPASVPARMALTEKTRTDP